MMVRGCRAGREVVYISHNIFPRAKYSLMCVRLNRKTGAYETRRRSEETWDTNHPPYVFYRQINMVDTDVNQIAIRYQRC